MKIRMLSILSSSKYGNAQPGRILTVDEQDGRDLIAGHYAVLVQDEARKDRQKDRQKEGQEEGRKEGQKEEQKEDQESSSARESAVMAGGEQAILKAASPRTRGKAE